MITLGIHEGHCATAAIMKDGKVLCSISEERLTRVKNDFAYPRKAINKCLEISNLKPKDIDHVAIASAKMQLKGAIMKKQSTFSLEDYYKEQEEYWYPKLYENKEVDYYKLFQHRIDQCKDDLDYDISKITDFDDYKQFQVVRKETVINHLGIDEKKVQFYNHHKGHAFYGYYASPFRDEDVLVVTADGFGDDYNATVSEVRDGIVKRVYASNKFNIGRIYSFVTLMLGMKPQEHEYKVMGMAPYVREKYVKDALKIFTDVIEIDGLDIKYKKEIPDHYFYFKKQLEHYRFDVVSAALQTFTEDLLTEWIGNWVKETGIGSVVFSGGVAMNVKANKRVFELDSVKKFHVPPSPADESLAMGVCYIAEHEYRLANKLPLNEIEDIKNAYLGMTITREEVEDLVSTIDSNLYEVRKDVTAKEVAALLADGEVVAKASGRMEFGARALGNRSIMANPKSFKMVKEINKKVKVRDFWMPFTPSMLKEYGPEYIKNPKDIAAKFMTITFDSTDLADEHLEAAMHPYDLTVRPQFVEQDVNPAYYEIIKEFQALTGIGAVLNTSFNISGLPVVGTAQHAFDDFRNSGLNYLLVENFLICKKTPV